jgi:hypothetical protein
VWPGVNITKVGADWAPQEIIDQIQLTRSHRGSAGHVLFRAETLISNPASLANALAAQVYTEPALPPAMRWLDDEPPGLPRLERRASEDGRTWLEWSSDDAPARWVLRARYADGWRVRLLPGRVTRFEFDSGVLPQQIALCGVDRCGNMSPPAVLP